MRLVQTARFARAVKKLHGNQKRALDDAINEIAADPVVGEIKKGDLSGVRVHKFKMVEQLTLIAYTFEERTITLTLLAFGSHENVYRDLKR
ncbi:MAG: type II toxin-antitoxin system RelE/ParE family toxin [Pseudomonadota bacterium]|nr:type II toxin-antitoxin system RelE/ParE family toxin [Pseudomonadota bacterium]